MSELDETTPNLGAVGRLMVDYRTLQQFKHRVDVLLQRWEQSRREQGDPGDQQVTRAAYGTGFAEADNLAQVYETVRARLETFSAMFAEQIEAMGIAVTVADQGYESLEEDVKQRLAAIQLRTGERYRAQQAESEREQDRPRQPEETGSVGADGL